ncbi:sigma 54-interacting transcriptional regulator [Neobacillus cucumis]|uniref:sigma 54-interacting transcriptional regulator n=1 Tax=Neobacillus cucumis TaxID=1740721 RepID=UPI0015E0E722|nr:sigma-54 dependent transcriptional regulator [Neobacillus cucumis]
MDISYIIKSPLSIALYDMVKRFSNFPSTVLIEGEIGSGKEMVAETLHSFSNRSNMPFVKIDCGSISDQVSDNELFGTDRVSPGLFESANQGTLFLDEVGELSPKIQVKLLRFLQDRENDRAGGSWTKKLDIRIIASSSSPLFQLVKEKKFREELYYRLNIGYISVPPLRNRPEEILPLINHYLDYYCKEYKIKKWFKSETLEILKNYPFPGNILELRSLVEKLCISTNAEYILSAHLPEYIQAKPVSISSWESQVGEFESQLIRQALEIEGSIRKAAARLQISHATLLRKMQKLGIEK